MSHDKEGHIKKLAELIKGIEVAMLTTMDENGVHRSRPMATQQTDFNGDLWFFTYKSSPKVAEIHRERNVNLSYSNPKDNVYVSVSGAAQFVDDPQQARDLWSPAYRAWFPKGIDDPELTLLKVHVEQAEYWDTPGSAVVQLVGFLKAVATGKRADPGEHEKIELEKATSR